MLQRPCRPLQTLLFAFCVACTLVVLYVVRLGLANVVVVAVVHLVVDVCVDVDPLVAKCCLLDKTTGVVVTAYSVMLAVGVS